MRYPIKRILTHSKTVALVGLSAKSEQDSYEVACYLLNHGYDVIPINPGFPEIMGRRSYASVRDLPEPPDVVDIFRRSEFAPEIVEDAIAIGAKAVWMQLGISHPAAAKRARDAGLMVVMNHCMKREHERLNGAAPTPRGTCRWNPPAQPGTSSNPTD
jgi:predicted CoA-binding protein